MRCSKNWKNFRRENVSFNSSSPKVLTTLQQSLAAINIFRNFNNSVLSSIVGEEEMKLIAGGVELQEKWQKTIHAFTRNIDQDVSECHFYRKPSGQYHS